MVLLALTIDGVRVGFVRTFFSTIRMIIGVLVAYCICFFLEKSFPEFLSRSVAAGFIVLIGIIFTVLGVLERILNIVDKISVTRFVNRAAGLAAGLLKGVILVWLLFCVISYYAETGWGAQYNNMLQESRFLSWINSFSPLRNTIFYRAVR